MDDWSAWVGRAQTASDRASASVRDRLAGLLDYASPPWPPCEMPPLSHWLHFLPAVRQSGLGPDGHAATGDFLPPVDLPRRMWAGGRLNFPAAIPLGAQIERRSVIAAITPKTGRSGAMVFVTVSHQVVADGVLAVEEEQDIVYREAALPGAKAVSVPEPEPTQAPAGWTRRVQPDPTLLFRYSALTYNSHRIHYDRDYARDVEGYQGLVVHGPLLATLLLDHYTRRHPRNPVTRFAFRAERPAFDGAPLLLKGRLSPEGAELWASTDDGQIAMRALVGAGEPTAEGLG